MGTAVLRSQDCLKGSLHLDAFGSLPPPPPKPYRKKSSAPFSPSSSHPILSSPPASKPSRRRHSTARSSPPPQANPPRRHRKSPSPTAGSASDGEIQPAAATRRAPLVMGEVRILRRGEELKPAAASLSTSDGVQVTDGCDSAASLFSTDRIGPEPEILPKKMGLVDLGTIYAGPAFFSSPAPSSLPIPGFFLKKATQGAFSGDDATRALRSMLRLDAF